MAVRITPLCINCNACARECPNKAIYAGGEPWSLADGTILTDNALQKAFQQNIYYVVPQKCTHCIGFNERPACMEVCPVEAIVYDGNNRETTEQLIQKYKQLQG